MASVTVTEAAKLANTSRKTIYAHIKRGKLTSRLDKDKVRKIDTSELVRVYDIKVKGNTRVTPEVTPKVTEGDVTGNTQGNTINLTPKQLQDIIKGAVAEALKEVMPILIEYKKEAKSNQDVKPTSSHVIEPEKRTGGYLDDLTFGIK